MVHFLLVILPAQGHINPTLQFAKRLIRMGAYVTFATSVHADRRMIKPTIPITGLNYATFSDGNDDGLKITDGAGEYFAKMKEFGSQTLSDLIHSLTNEGRPVTCVVYTICLQWVADVAKKFGMPSVLLWVQPALVFRVLYHYFHGYDDLIHRNCNDPYTLIELPGLPPLMPQDLPTLLLPSRPSSSLVIIKAFKDQFETLDKDAKPTRVLLNTFDALEDEALTAVDGIDLVGIGPLIPSAFLDGVDPLDTSFGGDFLRNATSYIEWLDSKPNASVVYVSFGSILVLSKQQMEEILRGLKEANRPFLWVVRKPENGTEIETDFSESLGACKEGLVVPWCSQVEVLSHPSVGCFVTHCGWNSLIESLVMGIPIVGFPQAWDQMPNANLIVEFCKKGVRARVTKEGVLESDELKRCLDLVMGGEKSGEIRKNCEKWRDLAREAVSNGGSSDRQFREFVAAVSEGR